MLICLRDWLSVLEKERQQGMQGRRRNKTQMGVERWNRNLEHAGLGPENLDKTVTRGEMCRDTGSPGALGLRHAAVWGGALLATSHSHHLCLSLERISKGNSNLLLRLNSCLYTRKTAEMLEDQTRKLRYG